MMALWRMLLHCFRSSPPKSQDDLRESEVNALRRERDDVDRKSDRQTDELLAALRNERRKVEAQTETMRRRYAYEDLYPRRQGR